MKDNTKIKAFGISAALTASLATGFLFYTNSVNAAQEGAYKQQLVKMEQETETLNERIKELDEKYWSLMEKSNADKQMIAALQKEIAEENARAMHFRISAYDLSESSCDKGMDHPAYGITASGVNLAGQSLESARAIAVDPNVIPLGSKVKISFIDPSMKVYDGIYTAVDTGGAIKGARIDLFFGDFQSNQPSQEAIEFGIRDAKVIVL